MSINKYVINRRSQRFPFDKQRIYNAIEKAFLSENVIPDDVVDYLTNQVIELLFFDNVNEIDIENIQDCVEEVLMQNSFHKIAKAYILYRQKQTFGRQEEVRSKISNKELEVSVSEKDTVIFNPQIIEENLRQIADGLYRVSITKLLDSIQKNIYNKITQSEINSLVLSASRDFIEEHYEYSFLSSRIVINELYNKILNKHFKSKDLVTSYQNTFQEYINKGIDAGLLTPAFLEFDLTKISSELEPSRDKLFMYLGTQILSDRYLLRDRSDKREIFELPQWFWMRVAMGLSLKEENKEETAVSFYHILSKMDVVSSTPTLFNSGTTFSQMSSCYLNTVDDSLSHIFKVYSDNAHLSKWAGGIGTDWTTIRSTGSRIKGTNGESQGIIPFIKIFNDVALAVNQGGKRKGAMCAYIENWHLDIEQFLELKKNTGDERRRAHDINTACWISDLFMKRVENNQDWTLFCPSDVPDLHDLYGKNFEERYAYYESKNLPRSKTIKALDLWRKMLTMLFETGHPWVTFKDPCNVRSPQDHVGVVHSSNLCTEITLNTSKDETAVCNLASLNLANFITKDKQLDHQKLKAVTKVAIRMLDNVIDNNYYPTKEAENANKRHRPIGFGLMGYQDALYQLGISFDSKENVNFADESMEAISYYSILASSELAKERGSYESFQGSKWDRGILPLDTISLLENQRSQPIEISKTERLDWSLVRDHISMFGMRNSNVLAIAPTATIANISGVYPCTEPAFKNIYMKENLSGNFIVVNRYLTDALEKLDLWNPEIVKLIKLYDGSVANIEQLPDQIKSLFKETFEISMDTLIECAAYRSKWIDQSMSTNIFIATQSGKQLSDIYLKCWKKGLKTTYYLRTKGASQVTKATVESVQKKEKPINSQAIACSIANPDECEACQ